MADPSDANRLAPSDQGPDFNPNPSLDVSGDEAEYPVPRGPEDALINPDPSSKLLFGRYSPTDAQKAASGQQNGIIAYFGRPTGGRILMKKDTPKVADITVSNAGIQAMNKLWSLPDQWVEPAIRWIHLPGNNPDWVAVGVHLPRGGLG